MTGYTESNNFPGISGAEDQTFGGTVESFVARLSSTLTNLFQSTYLGGSQSVEYGWGIDIHPTTGDVYVMGYTIVMEGIEGTEYLTD